jgi:hypothetical protein
MLDGSPNYLEMRDQFFGMFFRPPKQKWKHVRAPSPLHNLNIYIYICIASWSAAARTIPTIFTTTTTMIVLSGWFTAATSFIEGSFILVSYCIVVDEKQWGFSWECTILTTTPTTGMEGEQLRNHVMLHIYMPFVAVVVPMKKIYVYLRHHHYDQYIDYQ